MNIYFSQHELVEGFEILDQQRKGERLARGRQVSRPSGWTLFSSLRDSSIRCWACGCEAKAWIATSHRNDHVKPPVLNLYGFDFNGQPVLMTRDHIIPRAWGGSDDVENLRPACQPCNQARGHQLSEDERRFMEENEHLRPKKLEPEIE